MNSTRVLVKFTWDCGRQGCLTGLFVTTTDELEKLNGKTVYFGEVLGKHSDVSGTISPNDFKLKSNNQDFIDQLVEVIGSETISGYNPFNYYEPDEDEETEVEEE